MAVSGVGNSSSGATTQNTSLASLSSNFETFMTLLTAQLKAQDPLSPLDTKDFTNQLVQFSGVEQQIKTNDLLTKLSSSLSVSAGSLAVSYLGKTATATTNEAAIADNKAVWNYQMPANATSVAMKIYDSNNKLVYTGEGEKAAGSHSFEWNGKSSNGTQNKSGTFKLVIEAKNSSGVTLSPSITRSGTISYVDMSGSEPKVKIDGFNVELSSVTSVAL